VSDNLPNCSRCDHPFEEHRWPGPGQKPWPCAKCDCPGFVFVSPLSGEPPYYVEETDEEVGVLGTRLTKQGAERLKQEHPPIVPSYRTEVRKAGWFRWEVVFFQNLLKKRPSLRDLTTD
jgi:hypothetical protein